MSGSPSGRRWPWWTAGGPAFIVAGILLLAGDVEGWNTLFFLFAWVGHLLFVDALLVRVQGHSFLRGRRRELGAMLLWSVPYWCLFEACNLRLHNWHYVFLVPPPRLHQLTYHGVLAPASSWRSDIVPASPSRRRSSCGGGGLLPLHRYSFSELMKRVFRIDALKCAKCGSERRWIAAITNADSIAKILDHLDLPSARLQLAPPRAPPQQELGFEGC